MKRIIFFALSLLFIAPMVCAAADLSELSGVSNPEVNTGMIQEIKQGFEQGVEKVKEAVNSVLPTAAAQSAPVNTPVDAAAPVTTSVTQPEVLQQAPSSEQPASVNAPATGVSADASGTTPSNDQPTQGDTSNNNGAGTGSSDSNVTGNNNLTPVETPKLSTFASLKQSGSDLLGKAVSAVTGACTTAQTSWKGFADKNPKMANALIVTAAVTTVAAASYVVYKKVCKRCK